MAVKLYYYYYIASVHQYTNDYQAVVVWGMGSSFSMADCFPEKLRWCSNGHACPRMKSLGLDVTFVDDIKVFHCYFWSLPVQNCPLSVVVKPHARCTICWTCVQQFVRYLLQSCQCPRLCNSRVRLTLESFTCPVVSGLSPCPSGSTVG